jgi:hypothetical protein
MVTRRQVLAGGVAALTASVGAPRVGTAQRSDATGDHYDEQPTDVELVYDRDLLKRYQPLVRVDHLLEEPNAMFGLVARDTPDAANPHGTDALVYFMEYDVQRGTSSFDSHFGDVEPIYVFRNKSDGSIRRVIYTAYHWLKAEVRSPDLLPDGSDLRDGTHPLFRAIRPYHHYSVTTRTADEFVDLANLVRAYPDWLTNGLNEKIAPGAVTNPWSMLDRESWWRDSEAAGVPLGFSYRATVASLRLQAGLDRAGATDLSDGGLLGVLD